MIKPDEEITWEEFRRAITKLKNGKPPGLNDIPPDTFKSLTQKNFATLLDHLNLF